MAQYIPFVNAAGKIGERMLKEVNTLVEIVDGSYTGPDRTWKEVPDALFWGMEQIGTLPWNPPSEEHPEGQSLEDVKGAVVESAKKKAKIMAAPAVKRVQKAMEAAPGFYSSSSRDVVDFGWNPFAAPKPRY